MMHDYVVDERGREREREREAYQNIIITPCWCLGTKAFTGGEEEEDEEEEGEEEEERGRADETLL